MDTTGGGLTYSYAFRPGTTNVMHYGVATAATMGLPPALIGTAKEISTKLDRLRADEVAAAAANGRGGDGDGDEDGGADHPATRLARSLAMLQHSTLDEAGLRAYLWSLKRRYRITQETDTDVDGGDDGGGDGGGDGGDGDDGDESSAPVVVAGST